MMRKIVLIAVVLASSLCVGQGCPSNAVPDVSSGQLVPQIQGIPEGIYSGPTTRIDGLFASDGFESYSETDSTDSFLSQEFGPAGVPLTIEGYAMLPGDIKSVNIGVGVLNAVATTVTTDVDKCVIRWDVAMEMTLPPGITILLSGMTTDTYELVAPGIVTFVTTTSLAGYANDGSLVLFDSETTGELSR